MKKFGTSFVGYRKSEVSAFVRDVTKEYETMLNNLKNRDHEIETLKQKLIHYQNMETTLNRALLVAEDASNQIKKWLVMSQKELSRMLNVMLHELLMKHL